MVLLVPAKELISTRDGLVYIIFSTADLGLALGDFCAEAFDAALDAAMRFLL